MSIQEASRTEYVSRINKVMEFVDEHYFEQVDLDAMARIAQDRKSVV